MSLANIFAGIGGAFTAVQKGMDDAQLRKDKDQERQWRAEDRDRAVADRAFQDEQRGVWRKQQARADEDYEKNKTLQDDLNNNFNEFFGDGSGTAQPTAPMSARAATQAPATPVDKVTAPDPALGDRGVATVEPGASSAPPAVDQGAAPKTLPKRMTWADLQRKNANSLVRAGKPDDALKLIDAANKWDLDQASRGLDTLVVASPSMSDDQFAKSAADMFNSDPLPTQVRDIKVNPDGSFSAVIFGTESGKQVPVSFKNRNELINGLRSQYQREAFAKMQAAAAESQSKRREELLKPFTLKPGEVRQVFDEATGKLVTIGEGGIKPGYELVTSPNGEVIQRPIAKDGKGGKQDSVADIVLDQATKGEVKLTATQISDAQLRANQIKARGVPDYVAANVAIKVAQDPTLVKPSIDPRTGEIHGVYTDPALGEIVVDKGVASARDPKGLSGDQMKSFARTVVERSDPASRDQFVRAAFSPDARAKFESGLRSEITKQFDELIAKQPNAKAQLEAQRDATIQSSLQALGRKLDIINGHYPKPKDEGETPPRTLGKVGGLSGAAKYVPPADSPAGKAAARRQEQQDARAETERLAARSRAERAPGASSQAADIVKRGDMAAAYRLQQSPDFDLLTREEKVAVYNVVNGIKR